LKQWTCTFSNSSLHTLQFQHSPPAKNTRSQRNPAVLTPKTRVPLDCTPSVHQLSANQDRGAAPSRRGGMKSGRSRSFSGLLGGYLGMSEGEIARLGEAEDEEGEESVEEEDSEKTEVETALQMMEQMTPFMRKLTQTVSPRDNSKSSAFKTSSMRKKVPYSTSFLTGRAGNWIEHYLSNISNEDPSYLLNNWKLFETQLFTLFGDPNEVRKVEQELDNLRIKESGHVSLYIAYFRSLM
ncbi:hypothetical protein O181_111154, partial [Austropuccinia psidii MF-1]|nr:hypothetical protein [Austropuccinia psidii MF-1]